MEQTLPVKGEALTWKQAARDTNGRIIADREVPVFPERVRQEADDYVAFLRRSGADLRGSVLSEIEANKLKINSLLQEVRTTRSSEEVQVISQQLNAAVELPKYLEMIYRTVSIPVDGAVLMQQHEIRPGQREEVYNVMFARDGGAGPLRTRLFVGREGLVDFLRNDLHINERAIDEAWKEFERNKSASIPNVRLTYYDLVHLGLA